MRIAGLFTTMINLHSNEKGSHVPPSSNIKEYIARMEQEGVARVKMFLVITVAYLIFWGPLFLVTLVNWSWEWKDAKKSMSHEVKAKSNLQSTFFLIPRSLFMWPLSTPLSTHFSLLSSTRVAGGYPVLKKFSHKHRRATLDLLCCNFSQYSARETQLASHPDARWWKSVMIYIL